MEDGRMMSCGSTVAEKEGVVHGTQGKWEEAVGQRFNPDEKKNVHPRGMRKDQSAI
jgi:hypothetical protein